MHVCLEVKVHFDTREEKLEVINAMRLYSTLVKYGIKCLRPQLQDKKNVYGLLTAKFPQVPARAVSLAVQGDIVASINSFAGLQAKDYPPTLRFDKDCAEFFVEDETVKVTMAIHRPAKGELKWITASLMPQRSLKYKYYRLLFETEKGYRLPFKLVMRNGQIYAKISVEMGKLVAVSHKPHVNVGIDLNAFWVGKDIGHPLAVAFLNDDGSFMRQPLLMKEWADIPRLIRRTQKEGKKKVKKIVTNQMGMIVKRLLELTKNHQPTFKLENLSGLNKVKGAYSKFAYKKFASVLETKSLNIAFVDPAYTSQTCSRCGRLGKVQNRTFFCPSCYPVGFNRDINAAINIAKL
jgi:hypothetical protein